LISGGELAAAKGVVTMAMKLLDDGDSDVDAIRFLAVSPMMPRLHTLEKQQWSR
jgi:hypothetical protein